MGVLITSFRFGVSRMGAEGFEYHMAFVKHKSNEVNLPILCQARDKIPYNSDFSSINSTNGDDGTGCTIHSTLSFLVTRVWFLSILSKVLSDQRSNKE